MHSVVTSFGFIIVIVVGGCVVVVVVVVEENIKYIKTKNVKTFQYCVVLVCDKTKNNN